MDLPTIAIWAALLLIGLGVLAIVLFGIKSIMNGKFRLAALGAMAVPIVVFLVSYAISSGADEPLAAAGVLTSLILLGAGMLAILLTGLRGLIGY